MRAIFSKYLWLVMAGGLLAGSSVYASKVLERARLIVEDGAGMFSDDAKAKAKATVNEVLSGRTTEVHLETYAKLSESDQKAYKQIEEKKDETARKQFWVDWMKDKVRGDKGIVILINKSPGHVHVVADRQTHEGGFTREKESTLQSMLTKALSDAAKKPEGEQQATKDKALLDAADYLKHNIPTVGATGNKAVKKEEGGWQSYLCIGLCVLLGVWLVIGLIRAFSGGGGGGYGPGGGGGGGFMSSLFGGLFGAMAGMWLYNSMFGHDTSSAYGSDTGGMGGDTGAGDFGGSEGSGGDFGSGGSGGDFGGGGSGGGDWGAGGDWGGGGGGGGDWGGGGGDF